MFPVLFPIRAGPRFLAVSGAPAGVAAASVEEERQYEFDHSRSDNPVVRAAWSDDPAAVERAAADPGGAEAVNGCDGDGFSALAVAALRSNPAVVEALLAAGADANAACPRGGPPIAGVPGPVVETALAGKFAAKRSSDRVRFVAARLPDTGVTYGSEPDIRNRLEALEALFRQGADPNAEADGEPLLLVAILTGDRRFVEALVSRGALPGRLGFQARLGIRFSGHGDLLRVADEEAKRRKRRRDPAGSA